MLKPAAEGTVAQVASSAPEIRDLLTAGLSVADVALPRTAPPSLENLNLFE